MDSNDTMHVDVELTEPISPKTFTFSAPSAIPRSPKLPNTLECTENVIDIGSNRKSTFTFAAPATVLESSSENESSGGFQSSEKQYKPKITRTVYKPSATIFAQALKETNAYDQIKKNTRTPSTKCNINNSITCVNVPKALINKQAAKEYFTTFGRHLKIAIRPKKRIIIVTYATKDEATVAYNNSGEYMNEKFHVEWSKIYAAPKSPAKKKEIQKDTPYPQISENPIKSELDAMVGHEYNVPDMVERAKVQPKAKAKTAKPVQRAEKLPVKTDKVKLDSQISDLLPNASVEELQNIIQQAAFTSEDKYKVLEARDRLMRLKQVKSHSLATAKVITGTCPDMCPEKERMMRESTRQVALYEQLDSNDYKIDHAIAIKQYSRSSADQEEPMPHDLRPVSSLKMTMSYLLHEIADLCDQSGTNIAEWYHFLWDRTRGIRKDITQQELCCVESVELVEQCARFHILCSERLCAEESSVFDKKINSDNLTKCLQSLKYMYHDLRVKGITCPNESEFRAYIILLNLNNGNFMWDLQRLPKSVQKAPKVQFALSIYETLQSNNYYKFFKLVRKTTYLNACILLRYFYQVRLKALSVIVKAYCRTTSTPYPLYELIDILGFEDEEETIYFCEQVGLNVSRDELHVLLNRQNFTMPVLDIKQSRAHNLIESKRIANNLTIGKCIAGGRIPEKTYKHHKPHSSFDSQGRLLPESLNAQDQSASTTGDISLDELSEPDEMSDVKEPNILERKEVELKVSAGQRNTFKPVISSDSIMCMRPATEAASTFSFSSGSFNQNITNHLQQRKSSIEKLEKPSTISTQIKSSTSPRKTQSQTLTNIFSTAPTSSQQSASTCVSFSGLGQNHETTTSFGVPTNKNIFGSRGQKNIFGKNSSSSPVFGNYPTTQTSSQSQVSSKSQDIRDSAKGSSTAQQMLFKRVPQKVKDSERIKREELEQKQNRKIQQINENAENIYKSLQDEIVNAFCSEIVKTDIDQIEECNALSESIADQIIDEVSFAICNDIASQEVDNERKLHELLLRFKNRIVIKYFNIWKRNTFKRKRQREALNNTPVWLQRHTVEQSAQLLYTKEQKTVVQNMSKSPTVTQVQKSYREFLAPIEVIIYAGMKENQESLHIVSKSDSYWKLVISWPELDNKPILRHHKNMMNKYLNKDDDKMNPIIKSYHPNQFETLHICIRQIEASISDRDMTGTDALLFIASAVEDSKSLARRLTNTILAREKLVPMPLVFIILGDDKLEADNNTIESDLEALLESGYLSKYTIMFEKYLCEKSLLNLIQSAILWLAVNKAKPNPLEMDYLQSVADACLTEELWLRISDSSAFNAKLSQALKDPAFIVNLHNEAVMHLIDMSLDPESFMYTKFAPEFGKFLRDLYSLPCGYEYFSDKWRAEEYKVQIETGMSQFILPPWKYSWPIRNAKLFQENVMSYCQMALPMYDTNKMWSNILSNLFFASGSPMVSNFMDILLYIVREKIRLLDEDLAVIYNRNYVKQFQILPWWLKSKSFSEFEIPANAFLAEYIEEEEKERNKTEEPCTKKRRTQKNSEHSSSESDSSTELESLATFCENTQVRVIEVHHTAKEIEDLLAKQQRQNILFEEQLKNALLTDSDSVIEGL